MQVQYVAIVSILAIVSLFVIGMYDDYLQQDYPDFEINSSITERESSLSKINSSTERIQNAINLISNQKEKGFLSVLAEGIYALPLALVEFPVAATTIVTVAVSDITVMLIGVHVPPYVIFGIIVLISIWLIFRLLSIFAGKET
jgi:hypothetical protein